MSISVRESFSQKGYLAIKQPQFKKIETSMRGGLAVASQRTEMISVPLVMSYDYNGKTLHPNRYEVILRGDSGLASWAKHVFVIEGEEFVLCPETSIVGIAHIVRTMDGEIVLKVEGPE